MDINNKDLISNIIENYMLYDRSELQDYYFCFIIEDAERNLNNNDYKNFNNEELLFNNYSKMKFKNYKISYHLLEYDEENQENDIIFNYKNSLLFLIFDNFDIVLRLLIKELNININDEQINQIIYDLLEKEHIIKGKKFKFIDYSDIINDKLINYNYYLETNKNLYLMLTLFKKIILFDIINNEIINLETNY